jgi:hypothetical protein
MNKNPGSGGNMTPSEPLATIARATREWKDLLAAIDREEDNLEHVRRLTRDVFFSVRDALISAEQADGADDEAKQLFNAVVHDLYVFEPAADLAAEHERTGQGVHLSDLFCDGIAGMFEGQVRVRQTVEATPAEEFVTAGSILGDESSLAAIAKRLTTIDWWYVKWAAQRLRVRVSGKSAELSLAVFEGEAPSAGLNGWEVRVGRGREFVTGKINGSAATLKLPQRPAAGWVMQVREPKGEWADVFARVGAD